MPVIVSIHDATTTTLDRIVEIADVLQGLGCQSADILVVCGSDWSTRQIDTLRRLQDRGFRLQGHGWNHRASEPRNWFHRLHGWILSRDVAEHLSKPGEAIRELILNCRRWFAVLH